MRIVSYSELFKWDTCHRQYYYRFTLGLKPIEESGPITLGIKGHTLLQSFYESLKLGNTKEVALEDTRRQAVKLMESEKLGDFGILKAWTLVDNYIRETDFTSNAVLVENRFLFPFVRIAPPAFVDLHGLHDVQIGFTPDVVFERAGGLFDVEDSKFVARAWSKSKLNRFQQAKLYQIFLKKMGYNVTRSTVRFFNVTTGAIKAQNYTLIQAEEETLIHDFINGVKEVLKYRSQPTPVLEKARRTMNYTACQFCAFEFACTLEAQGKDASKTLSTEFVKSDYDYNR